MHKQYSAVALFVALSLSVPCYAEAASANKDTKLHDMACFVGMSAATGKSENDTASVALMRQNLTYAVFYYAGKIATDNPGQKIIDVTNGHMQEIADHIKSMDPASCMTEVRAAMYPPDPK